MASPLDQLYTLQSILDQVSSDRFRASERAHPDVTFVERTVKLGDVTVQRHGASQNGWSLEKTTVQPHTPAWEERMQRVYAGCAAVADAFHTGATCDTLDTVFKQYLDPAQDTLHGSVVKVSGDGSFDRAWDVVDADHFYTIGPFVGDGTKTVVPVFQTTPLYGAYRGGPDGEAVEGQYATEDPGFGEPRGLFDALMAAA